MITPAEVVGAVADLQAERDALRGLLSAVIDGHVKDNAYGALIQLPRETFSEIRARLN